MYRKYFLILLVVIAQTPLFASSSTPIKRIDVSNLKEEWMTPIVLEHAIEPNQLRWGLMGRKALEPYHGMTFNFAQSTKLSFWMFNCFIDLAVAFCDQDHIIREIHKLKAFPEKMDSKRPINSLQDLKQYPPYDPIVGFFKKQTIQSKITSKLALEMVGGWFEENNVHPGDVAVWHVLSKHGFICHTLDIGPYLPEDEESVLLEFPGYLPHSVWLPHTNRSCDLAFFNAAYEVLIKESLEGGGNLPVEKKPVLFTGQTIKYVLIAKKGSMNKQIIHRSTTAEKDKEYLKMK